MSPQVEKQQFENNTGGWVGAVTIDAKGNDVGIAVGPGQRVWLSEAEQRLTAEAPMRPEDNPFVEQSFERIDIETGERKTVRITPLTLVSDARYVPASERFVPAEASDITHQAEAGQAARGEEPVQPTSASDPVADRQTEVLSSPDDGKGDEDSQPETGAADPPSGPAPAGSFTPTEEVGTPGAPSAPAPEAPPAPEEQAPAGPPAPPAPYTPGSTE